jgi:transcriptional regulator with XRE-family HTH domain
METVTSPGQVFSPAALRAGRIAAGRTLREIGDMLGCKADTVMGWELGRVSPQADDLAAIANFLGVDITGFFPLEHEA